MHYLIKMCSLCLCHNKDLTKVDKIQQKYYNFLKKILIQPSDADKMKLEEEFLCKMCIDKLESCFGLSELCIKNKIYSTFCCVCTNSDRSKLMNLRKISPEVASFYCKLIKSVRPQIFTCEKCLEKLNFYLQFQKTCVKNDEMIFGYMQQLTNFSTEKIFKNTNVTIKIEKLDEGTIEKLTARKPTTTTSENLDQEKTEMEIPQTQEKLATENREKFLTNVQIVDIRSVKQEQIDIEENLIYEPESEHENEPHEIIPECKVEICDEENFNREPESNPPFNFTDETEEMETVAPKHSNMNYEESPLFFNHFLDSSGNDFDQKHCGINDMEESSEINPNDLVKIDENPDSPNLNNTETFTCKFCPDNKNIKSFKLHKFVHLDKSKNECLICHKQIKYYKNLVAHLRKHYREKPVVYYTTADMSTPQQQNRESKSSNFINPNFYNQPNHYPSEIQETKPTNSNFNANILGNFYNPEVTIVPKGNVFASKRGNFDSTGSDFASTGSNFTLKGSGFAPKGSNFASTGFTRDFSGDFVPKEEKVDPELDLEQEADCDPNSDSNAENFDVVSTFKNIPNLDSFGLQYLEEDVENMEESVESENFNDESGMSIESNVSGNNGNGEKFICRFCPDENNIFDSYRTHKFEHMDRIKVQCLICFKKLKYYRNLVVHVTDHFKGSQFYCPYCKMHQGEKLVEHKYKHINQSQNLCLICLKKFDNFNSLNVHIHTHFKNWQRYKKLTQTNPTSPSKTSQSQILHRQLLKKKILQNNSLERVEVTPTLNFDMYQNEPSTSSNDLFICPFCPGRQYSSQKQHKFVHMDRANNVCLICNSKFAAYKYLYKHLMKHFYRSNPYAISNSNSHSQFRPIAIRPQPQNQNVNDQLSIDLTSESVPRESQTQSFPPSYLKSLLSNEITLLPYDPRNQKGTAQQQQKVIRNIHFNANILGLPFVRDRERQERQEIVTDQKYTCPFCDDKEFPSFLEHKNVHIDRENNQCLICNGRFTGYAYVDRHVTKHLNERKNEICAVNTENNEFFNCQYCNCVVEETYYKHFYKHVNINERYCLICNKEFIHIKYLYKHLRNHFGYAKIKKFHIPDPTEDGLLRSCPFCIEPVNESLPLHRLVHIDPINKICLICYKRFGADENLLSHIAFHFRHFYRNYKTPTTTTVKSVPNLKVFKNAIAVNNQIEVPQNETVEKVVVKSGSVCPFCPNFAIEDLSDHKESHIKPDGNQCLICSENFETLFEVKNHIEEHFAEVESKSRITLSTKLFCRYCNIEVLRKSFEKHKISNMHLYYVKKNPLKKPLDPNASNSPNAGRSFCRVCKVYLNRKGFGKHKNSKMHRDNLRNKFPEKLEKKAAVSHRTFCRFCQTYITTKNFDEHKRTKKHLENMKLSKSENNGNDNDDNLMENENFEDGDEKVSAEVSAELVSELSNVDDNDTSITLDHLKSEILKNQNDLEDEDDNDNDNYNDNENLDHSESVTLENIEDQIVSDDKDHDQKPDKYFCSLCNTEVLRKSFAKHSISKMHLENLHSKNKNDGHIEKGSGGGGGGSGKRCPKCNRGFANQTSYLRHVKGDCKFVPAKFQCELCKARFRRRYILGAHMQKVHGLSVMDSI